MSTEQAAHQRLGKNKIGCDDFYTDVTVIERMLAFPTLKREYHVLKQEPGAAQKQMKQLMITVRSLTEVILEINP